MSSAHWNNRHCSSCSVGPGNFISNYLLFYIDLKILIGFESGRSGLSLLSDSISYSVTIGSCTIPQAFAIILTIT